MIKTIVTGRTSTNLNEVIQSRIDAALGQHERWVKQVDVRLWDANGPRRTADDQHCRMTIQLHGHMQVIIEETGHDPYAIVSTAADRAKQAVGRKVSRKRGEKSGGVPVFFSPKFA